MTITTIRFSAASQQSPSKSVPLTESFASARASLFGRGLRDLADRVTQLDTELEAGEKASSVPTHDQANRMAKASEDFAEAAYLTIALGSEYTYFTIILDAARAETAKLAKEMHAMADQNTPFGAGWGQKLDESVTTARECAKWLPF